MPNEISIVDREVQLLDRISAVEKHKSDNNKDIRLAEIAMSEKIAKTEIEAKKHSLEQEKDFRLTNTKHLYWIVASFFVIIIVFVSVMVWSGNKDMVIPILSFLAGALGGFGYGKIR